MLARSLMGAGILAITFTSTVKRKLLIINLVICVQIGRLQNI